MPTGSSGSPVTISYTVSYSIGADSANKDQAFVLLTYLTGKDGMTKWTEGGVALPSRTDVPTPAGKDVLTRAAPTPGRARGSCPATSTSRRRSRTPSPTQIQSKTYDADPVVDGDQGRHRQGPAAQ